MKIYNRIMAMILVMLVFIGSVPVNAVSEAEEAIKNVVEFRLDESVEEPWKIPDGYVLTGKTNYGEDNCKIFQLVKEQGTGGFEDIIWIRVDGSEVPNPDIPVLTFENEHSGNKTQKAGISARSSYDARDYGYVMPVENQLGGSCWAHATAAVAEANYIKKGFGDSVDFSEYQIVWYSLNGYEQGNTNSDNDGLYFFDPEEVIDNGGFGVTAEYAFYNFVGPATESSFPVKSTKKSEITKEMQETFTYKNRYVRDAVVTDVYAVPTNVTSIKKAIEEYGAVYMSYSSSYSRVNKVGDDYCYYTPLDYESDHAVTIIGWDDNFSKNNFGTYKPTIDGAWLVKNSWGTDWGNKGYFWISYEDKTIDEYCYVMNVEKNEDFQNVYQYDGAFYMSSSNSFIGAGNVFVAKGNEYITKVAYGGRTESDYTLKIYKNLPSNYTNPTQGTLAYVQKGKINKERFIELDGMVEVSAGERFAVVIEGCRVYYEGSNVNYNNRAVSFNSKKGEGFYKYGDYWYDAHDGGLNNICIKAITKNINSEPPYKITFRDPGYYETTYTTNTSSVTLPSARGYTYVFTYNGQPFTGTGIRRDMIVEMHCYPTDGKKISDCEVEYKCYYCNKTMKPSIENHVYKTTKVAASETSIGYTEKKCTVCNEKTESSYTFYSGSKNGKSGNLVWQYVNNNLAVLCLGDSPDYTAASKQPWKSYNSLIKKVTVAKGATRLGDYLFAGMKKMTKISLPSTVTEIGQYCFSGASSLEEFTCPSALTVIETGAFKDAVALTTINYNKKLTRLGSDVFAGCKGMKVGVVPGTLVGPDAIGWEIFQDCEALEKIVIEEGVTHFDKITYWGGSNLKEIVIPSTIESFACYNFVYLEKYTVSPANRYYTDVDGVLYNKNLTTLVSYPAERLGSYYDIPDTVKQIEGNAFYCVSNLLFLDMSCAVTTLEKNTFSYTFSISSVNLPSGLKKICTEALNNISFTNLYVPSTVTTIEKDAIIPSEVNGYYMNAFYTNSSSAAIKTYAANNGYKCYTNHTKHNYSTVFNEFATCEEDGVSLKKCACGCSDASEVVYRVKTVELHTSEYTYNGKTITPLVIVKDSRGIDLVYDQDYTLTYPIGSKKPGQYKITLKFMGDYYGTKTLTFKILPKAPATVSATQTANSIKLSWKASTGATGYRIYYKSGSSWKNIVSSTTATTYTIKNLKAASKYTYAVRPYVKSGNTVIWGKYTQLSTATKPAKVTTKVTSYSDSKISIFWNKVTGSEGYQVWYKKGDGSYKLYKTVSASTNSITFSNLNKGTKYSFAARAYVNTESGLIRSDYKAVIAATTPANPTAKVTAPSKGKLTVTWSAVSGAESYQVYYKTGNGSYKLYKTYSGVKTLNFTNLKSGTKYTFAVRAVIKTDGGNVRSGYKGVSATVK